MSRFVNEKGAPEYSVLLFLFCKLSQVAAQRCYFSSRAKNSSVAPYARIQLFHMRNP